MVTAVKDPIRVIGGGIAGLTAALSLRQAGFEVVVQERASEFTQLGAGIVLAPNAICLLSRLGVELGPVGHPIGSVRVCDARGRTIQQSDFCRLPSGLSGPLSFDRSELHQALLTALPQGLVQLGTPFKSEEFSCNVGVLIGADGIYSTVRRQIAGDVPIRYSGSTCWRAICPNPGIDEAFEQWAGASRVGVVPLTRNRIYVYLVRTSAQGFPRVTAIAGIRSHFEQLPNPIPKVLDSLAGTPLLHHDLEELDPPVWGAGEKLLIGDAAHAMTPNLGQGAGMAIEDAVVLPAALAAADPARELRRCRHQRVQQLQRSSRLLGILAHWQSPLSCYLRDSLLRSIPRAMTERRYVQMIEAGIRLSDSI
jgi:2-polyprenyl-6-methoxyphenol hydroxylase-like FAD-dependent oxidoreductase